MRKVQLLCLVLLCFVAIPVFAQYDGAPNAFGARALYYNYQFPISNEFDFDDAEFGAMELEYIRHLNKILNVSLPFRLGRAKLPTDEMGASVTNLLVGADALLQVKYFNESSIVSPYLFGGVGVTYEADNEETSFSAPTGLGVKFRLGKHIYFDIKGEYRFGFNDFRDRIGAGAGFTFILGGKGDGSSSDSKDIVDQDGDGVSDDIDLCPTVMGSVATKGCPDSDNDGVVDAQDLCPTIKGSVDMNGCPDTDGDGLTDNEDDCPTQPGLPSNRGCPVRDSDNDGIVDAQDRCPNTPGVASAAGCPDRDGDTVSDSVDSCPDEFGTSSTNGCPDTDGDGVMDKADKCPSQPGLPNNQGCPENTTTFQEEEIQTVLAEALNTVKFEPGGATLVANAYPTLDQIAQIMQQDPSYRLKIEGHTDSIGSRAPNKVLSEKRARACYDYLVSKGIDASRMEYEGLGEAFPIANNKYNPGREKNRRVEFKLTRG